MSINATYQRLKLLPPLLITLIVIQVVNFFSGNYFLTFGILPREIASLPYIFTAPFIHGNFIHLAGNLFGLSVFSILCLMKSKTFFIQNSLFIIVVSGLLVWCFARSSYHVGISGLIFGLWAMLIAQAYFQSNVKNILIAVLVMFFYGGMVFGVLPGQPGVSFESHLFGAIAGILCAYMNKVNLSVNPVPKDSRSSE